MNFDIKMQYIKNNNEVLRILGELQDSCDIEKKNKCVSFSVSEDTHEKLGRIAKSLGQSLTGMVHAVLLNLLAQIIANNYIFTPDLTGFDFYVEKKGGKPIRIHLTETVVSHLNRISRLNAREKSTIGTYAVLCCIKQKLETLKIDYTASPLNFKFDL